MVAKIIKYIIYIIGTICIIGVCVNQIFVGLHDHGQFGMFVGLILSQVIITPFLTKISWWGKILLLIPLIILPILMGKWIAFIFYSSIPDVPISRAIDLLAYGIFFIVSILIIELASFLFEKKD